MTKASFLSFIKKVKQELTRRETKPLNSILKVIIGEKSFKGVVLLLLSVSVFPVLSDETIRFIHYLARRSHMLSNARIFTRIFVGFQAASDKRLLAYSLFFFLWGSIELVEAIGLAKRLRWAEYLAVIGTGIFIPIELSTVISRYTNEKLILLLFNMFLVIYLIWSRKLFRLAKHNVTALDKYY